MITGLRHRMARLAGSLCGEAGLAQISAVITLTAVVGAGSGLAYAIAEQGDDGSSAYEAAATAALDGGNHVITATGPIYVQDLDDDGAIGEGDALAFDLSIAGGSQDVDLATLGVSILTVDDRYTGLAFETRTVTGDEDGVVEAGEVIELTVVARGDVPANERFTMELSPENGPLAATSRTMPPIVNGLTALY